MMLTTKQPVHYYRAVNDLPTPPRTSPTLGHQDHSQILASKHSANQSPRAQSMSGPHRGLPPLPGMPMPPAPPPPSAHQPPVPGPSLHSQALPSSVHSHSSMALSSQPHPDESSNLWYHAKVEEERRRQEEERRRQEEERTRQENLRLEQRKLEFDILRTSLDRGIPPQLVPIVFAAMGGGQLPQAILEYAQSYIQGQPGHAMQGLPAPPATSPEHHRDPQYAAYAGSAGGMASTPASSAGLQSGFIPYQGGASSPPRQRAHTLSMGGPLTRPRANSNLSRIAAEEQNAPGPPQGMPSYLRGPNLPPQATAPQTEQSPSIYFHHWQPPASQSQAAQPEAPSEESPRKRKATGPQQPPPPPSSQIRTRSPPFGHKSASARHRGHSRQRSDMSSYRPSTRARGDAYTFRGMSPGFSTPRDGPGFDMSSQQQQPRSGAHSVNSMLSEQHSPHFASAEPRQQSRPQHQDRPFHSQQQTKADHQDSPISNSVDEKVHSSVTVGPPQREPN
ncbi:hypothetical protein Micbo1qcDRAFT_4393 [Microdochium bolleyi]|uniref:Uncharacterized protein n=1 Tax=Microdochium bolleyi TaxID=196109 RepID=A0A136JIH7_9PEZI|nr:hypothetical protein Micbo1qcDRAFT_4393 [Microdochium bolleyi]